MGWVLRLWVIFVLWGCRGLFRGRILFGIFWGFGLDLLGCVFNRMGLGCRSIGWFYFGFMIV